MAHYKVLKRFKDIHSKELHEIDSTIELTKERFEEVVDNLSQYEGPFLEPVEGDREKKTKKTSKNKG